MSTIVAAKMPSAPQGVTATPGNAQVVLTWAAPASNGGSAITGYEVQIGINAWTPVPSGMSFTFPALTNGSEYTFKVRAVNAIGAGIEATATAIPRTVPDAPTEVTATPGNEQVRVDFVAPASNGGSAITEYTVTSSPGGITASGTSSPITVGGLSNGTPYTFTVKAVNVAGAGLPSAASATVTPRTVPGAPQGFTATPSNSQAYLAWTTPLADGGSAITGYQVSSDSGKTWVEAMNASWHIFTNLTNGEPYIFFVRAVNTAGSGAGATASATPRTVPGQPTNVTVSPGNESVTVDFAAPASNGGSAITVYTLTASPGDLTVNGASSPLIIGGLVNGAFYTFTVTATNVAGTGMPSIASDAVAPRTVPGVPRSLKATPGDGQIELSWAAPSYDGGSAVTGYEVTCDNGKTWVAALNSTGHLFTGLTENSPHSCRVRALNAAGSGAEATATATPRTAPGTPRNFTATPGDGQITLSWEVPASNGGSEILGYQVSIDNGTNWLSLVNMSYTFSGLQNGTSYTCRVRAVNAAGFSTEAAATIIPIQADATVPAVTISGAPEQYVWKAAGGNDPIKLTAVETAATAAEGGIAWAVDKTAIATISTDGLLTFSGVEGTVHVTATSKGSSSGYVDIKVVKNVTKIDTVLKAYYVQTGTSLTIPYASYDGKIEVQAKLSWKSSNPKVKVSQSGKVMVHKSLKKGKATITATAANGQKLSVKVSVSKKAVALKKMTVSAKNMKRGTTQKIRIKLAQKNATLKSVTFKSNKPKDLYVDKAGNLKALKKGTYTLTVKAGKVTVKKTVKVT